MGGGTLSCTCVSEDESFLDNDYPEFPYSYHPPTSYRDEDESVGGSNGFLKKEFEQLGHQISLKSVEFDDNLRRRKNAYRGILKSYDQLLVQRESLCQARSRILSYTPGSWVSNAGGKKRSDYVIPKTTTLLLIGPKGSGKSSLINKISRVFEDDKFASERAQATFNSSSGEGTYFLQEYMIPTSSTSFCLFDTRSLSGNFAEDHEMLLRWMREGVCHGELVIRDSDRSSLKMALIYKAQQSGSSSSEIRKVNFVIFVVNGLSVIRAMNSDKEEERRYMETVMKTFSCPYLSFRDDKPVIVVTHGDLLSLGDRARVRVYLGEKLDVPPAKQIFDIPENSDSSTELTIVDMIRYSLDHADKNLLCKKSREWVDRSTLSEHSENYQVFKTSILALMFLAVLLGIACVAFPMHPSHKPCESLLSSSKNWHCKSQVEQIRKPCQPWIEYPSNLGPTSAANHPHKNQGCECQEPHGTTTSTMPTKKNASTSAPISPSESVATTSECQEPHGTSRTTMLTKSNAATSAPTLPSESVAMTTEHQELHGTSKPAMLINSNVAMSSPISPLQSVATISEHQKSHGTPKPTMPTKSNAAASAPTLPSENVAHCPRKHPVSRSPSPKNGPRKPAVEWHKIRHLWWDSEPAVEWHKIRHLWWDSD